MDLDPTTRKSSKKAQTYLIGDGGSHDFLEPKENLANWALSNAKHLPFRKKHKNDKQVGHVGTCLWNSERIDSSDCHRREACGNKAGLVYRDFQTSQGHTALSCLKTQPNKHKKQKK